MKTEIMIAFLVITLAACAPAQTNTTDIQNTAVAIVQTGVALTQTTLPTATLPPPTFTSTALPTSTTTPTLIPTEPPPPILTPDALQVERWKEYQTELAKLILSDSGADFPYYETALCEWDILGRSNQEVYVWAMCSAPSIAGRKPAVIYLQTDGSIRKVKVAGYKGLFYDLELFPTDIQEKINLYPYSSEANELAIHLNYRLTHPEEPPLVVLSAMPTSTPAATPTPTQPIVPIITPDPIQVERWKEYEKALAQSIFPTFPFEPILCEWDILARSGQEVYVWAVCAFSKGNDWRPAVIHLGADGSVHSVEIPKRGSPSDINRMFPEEAQAKFSFYSGDSLFNGRLKELLNHLYYRLTYPEEPPLIVLLATPIP